MTKNDGYSVIVERPFPYEMAVETIPAEVFDSLCKKSQNNKAEEVENENTN